MHDDWAERPSIVDIIEILNKVGPVIDKENEINVPTYGLTAHKTLDIMVSHPYVLNFGHLEVPLKAYI